MVNIEKPIHRRTRGAYRVLYQAPRQIVVTLAPGDIIEFREAGRRARYPLAIDTAFRYALKLYATAKAAERKAARKNKKQRGF